jgi:hypothetical protein
VEKNCIWQLPWQLKEIKHADARRNHLKAIAKHATTMARPAADGETPTRHVEAEHKRLTAELAAVELLMSLDRTRYPLAAALLQTYPTAWKVLQRDTPYSGCRDNPANSREDL